MQTGEMPPADVDASVRGLFAESLILTDAILVPLYGPNTEIVALLRWLGIRNLERLLEDRTLRFAFAPGVTGYVSKANVSFDPVMFQKTGLERFSGAESDWRDPADSTVYALGKQTDLDRPLRRRLGRLVERTAIILPVQEIYDRAFDVTRRDARGSQAAALGLSEVRDPESGELPKPLQTSYINWAHANIVVEIAARSQCVQISGDEEIAQVLKQRVGNAVKMPHGPRESLQAILDFEGMPQFERMLTTGRLSFEDVLKLRERDDTRKFRDWLGQVDATTAAGVIRDYARDTFYPTLGDSMPERVARVAVLNLVGLVLNPLPPEIGIPTNLAVSAFEEFLLDRLRRKWSPRVFIETVQREVASADEI